MKQRIYHYGILFIGWVILIGISGGCKDDFSGLRYDSDDKMQIYDYVASRPDLSIYKELTDYTGFNSLISTAGTYTAFIPTNDGFTELFKKLQISNIQDKPAEYWLTYLQYHTIQYSNINTNTMENGKIPYPTMLGLDYYIVADIRESYKAIKLNSQATIKEYNITLANGYVDVLDRVLLPPIQSVYDMLNENGNFKTMLAVFEKTGLTDYLKDSVVTVMIEPDVVFERTGFNPDTVKNLAEWAAYHIMYGKGMFSGDLKDRTIYSLYPEQPLTFSVDEEGKLWCNKDFGFSQSTLNGIDNVAKNGVYHVLDTTVSIVEALPGIRSFNLYGKTVMDAQGYVKHEQNVFTEAPAMIQEDLGTASYHQDKQPPICGFNAFNIGDYFYLTLPDVVKGKFQVRMIFKQGGSRANFMMIYKDNIITKNISMTSGTNWTEYTSLQYKDMGVITVDQRGPVKLLFQVTKLNAGPDYCCDLLMDMIELHPVK